MRSWARLLAYSIAEGHELIRPEKHEAEIRIGVKEKDIIKNITSCLSSMGKTWREWKARPGMHYIGISIWKDLDFLKEQGYEFGKRAGEKQVPGFVMTGDKQVQQQFLSALFDCDGGFVGHQVIYTTKSKTLANQLAYLLLNSGIHSRIRKRHNKKFGTDHYRLEMSGDALETFEKDIGFTLPKKREKLRTYIGNRVKPSTNRDVLPINDYVLEAWTKSGRTKKSLYTDTGYHFWDYATKKRYPTQQLLTRANEHLQDQVIEKFQKADVYFDRVKHIREVKFDGYVYDVVVPETHTFIGGFGGILLHNTMGLAPYGDMNPKTNEYYKKLMQTMDVRPDGSFRMDMSYFIYHYKDRMPSRKLCKLLGGPVRKPESELTQRHKDIAAGVQLVTEEVMTRILTHVHKKTKSDNIVLAGGVALNSVYNGKILSRTPFKKIWIQPAAGDGGTSVGVAAYIYNTILGKKRVYTMRDAFLGPSYSRKEIKEFLDEQGVNYTEYKTDKQMIKGVSKLLAEDNVIGWFQKGMEWGPRALGARSILSNPTNTDMQAILNEKVKHREKFRPFAPVVCADDAKKYFKCDSPVPEPTDYMLMVYPIKKQYHKKIPSVTHVDGSGRLQTIRKKQNPRYYDLIKAFGKRTGIPILINTSFNIRGEPIVCTPYDAYRCMMGTGIDYLVIDRFLVKRDDNPQDMWDSEKYAID